MHNPQGMHHNQINLNDTIDTSVTKQKSDPIKHGFTPF